MFFILKLFLFFKILNDNIQFSFHFKNQNSFYVSRYLYSVFEDEIKTTACCNSKI